MHCTKPKSKQQQQHEVKKNNNKNNNEEWNIKRNKILERIFFEGMAKVEEEILYIKMNKKK